MILVAFLQPVKAFAPIAVTVYVSPSYSKILGTIYSVAAFLLVACFTVAVLVVALRMYVTLSNVNSVVCAATSNGGSK
ncbi:MAG: hypothetical protein II956_07290 [Bacteroidales bacterium]|nr:hypothetical protein [Bacteroidales bacterium]